MLETVFDAYTQKDKSQHTGNCCVDLRLRMDLGDNNSRYPAVFECAKIFEIQENVPVAGGAIPSYSLGEWKLLVLCRLQLASSAQLQTRGLLLNQ